MYSRLGLLAIAAAAWPTAAGTVVGLWATFTGVFAVWLRLTWGRTWFGERYLDLLVVKYILSHPQDPLVSGLMTSPGGAAAIPGLNILPEDRP